MGNNAISALNNATSLLCNATSALSNVIRYVYQAKLYCINDFWFHAWTSSNTLSSIVNFIQLLYQVFAKFILLWLAFLSIRKKKKLPQLYVRQI